MMLLPLLESLDSNRANTSLVESTLEKQEVASNTDNLSSFFYDTISYLGLDESIISILIVITFAFVLKGLVVFLSLGYSAYLQGKLLRMLKAKMFDNFSTMHYEYYASKDTGHFLNVINEQINRSMLAFNYLNHFGSQIINAIIYLLLASVVAWSFGMMALVAGACILFLFRWLSSTVRDLSRKTAHENGILTKRLIGILHAFKYLNSTNQMVPARSSIIKSIELLASFQIKAGIAAAFVYSAREPIAVTLIMLIIFVQLTVLQGPLAPILVSIVLFYRGMNTMVNMQGSWQKALEYIGSMELVHKEFIDQYENKEHDGNKQVNQLFKGIQLKDVCFRYGPDLKDVLKDINLEISSRSSVALIGSSGAGKSTLLDIITLMLKPYKGKVLINDISGEQVELSTWRKQIGYVSQETVIFDDSIACNICMWSDDSTNEDVMTRIKNAAHQAHIAHFIESLPDGYSTMVGERGLRLSGGQRQRIFIARELYRKPSVLLLDEATSALDSESEQAIKESIDALKGKITVIIIAHRLSTIRNVDHLLVFEQGMLVEQGNYDMLRNDENSRFSKLISMQSL